MNEGQKIYCDGAAMAYRDCSKKIFDLIEKSPPELKSLMDGLMPLAIAMQTKAETVYEECEKFTEGERQ